MKKYFFLFILMFLSQTGNVLSNTGIFSVDNIEVDTSVYKNKESWLNFAFKKGFNKLTTKILIKNDVKKVSNLPIKDIKNLISYYQILNKDEKILNEIKNINIFFDKEKISNFFYKNDILYADIFDKEITILPILFKDKNFFIYSNNFFYENWKNQLNKKKNVEYILPVETLEHFQIVKNKLDKIETIKIIEIFPEQDNKNYFFIAIEEQDNKLKIFIKGLINKKEVVKSFSLDQNDSPRDVFFKQTITKAKEEIEEMIKSKNLIDVKTPSFLNVKLNINKIDDLINIQNSLTKIDLIEKFNVTEINNKYARIKIKYYGKLDNITKKIEREGIEIIIFNDAWTIKKI